MKSIARILVLSAVTLTLTQCMSLHHTISPGASEALEYPQAVALFRLDENKAKTPALDASQFHGYTILAKSKLDERQKQEVTQAVKAAIDKGTLIGYRQYVLEARPRHGVRVAYGNHFYDFELCYECGRLYVFEDGNDEGWVAMSGKPDRLDAFFAIPAAAK